MHPPLIAVNAEVAETVGGVELRKCISRRDLQFANTLVFIVVTLAGIVIFVKESQLQKVDADIVVKFELVGSVILPSV